MRVLEDVPLAPRCTMRVGGTARHFAEAVDERDVVCAAHWARRHGAPLRVLGGGSNLVVADEGVDGLVVHVGLRGISSRRDGDRVELTAAAGEPWDDVVRHAVDRGWAGVECLSGIPGLTGATPIQNVGAYGQDVSETIVAVRVFDRGDDAIVSLTPAACAFAYRDSVLKSGCPDRYVVLAVTYRLLAGGQPRVAYADIATELDRRGIASPALGDVRDAVLAIRRAKSMVLDPDDPNSRGCGSFFLNPQVSPAELAAIERRMPHAGMPRWPQPDGRVKLSAGWLIERAGFARGTRDGPVGLSTRHSLAIVSSDGARAADVIRFARRIQAAVEERCGVRLVPEPSLWGF